MDEVTTEDVFGPEVKKVKPETVEPEAKEEPEQETPEPEEPEQPKDTGETAPPPGETQVPKGYVPLAAIEDERRKRQEYEKRVKDYEKRLQELEQTNQKVPEQYRDDPEGYVQRAVMNATVNLSREMVASLHPDYEEMENYLVERTNLDPVLAAQVHVGLQSSRNPAKFAYDTAKRLKREEELEAAGGWEKWREAERERIRKELEAQVKPQVVTQQPVEDAPPESLAAAPSTVSQKETFKTPSTDEVFN